ncbi:MAG: SurA N-terminal domain-containing protein [Elusimicrobia bacterium]|nr:SurA N-terminal domain-containing protein [Elusimicrobiota bacterium]
MMHWFRKHKNTILIIMIAGFVISTFVGFGFYLRSGASLTDTIAEVNREKIPLRRFSTFYNQVINSKRDRNEDLSPQVLNQIKQDVVQSLVQESVFYQEAKRYDIYVTDLELAQTLASVPSFQRDGKFDPKTYVEALNYGFKTTPKEFEESQRRQIAIGRLRAFILQGIKVTDRELEQEFTYLSQTLPEKDRDKTLEDFKKNPEAFREKIRQEKSAHILNRWYQQLGSNAKLKMHLESLENRVAQ